MPLRTSLLPKDLWRSRIWIAGGPVVASWVMRSPRSLLSALEPGDQAGEQQGDDQVEDRGLDEARRGAGRGAGGNEVPCQRGELEGLTALKRVERGVLDRELEFEPVGDRLDDVDVEALEA